MSPSKPQFIPHSNPNALLFSMSVRNGSHPKGFSAREQYWSSKHTSRIPSDLVSSSSHSDSLILSISSSFEQRSVRVSFLSLKYMSMPQRSGSIFPSKTRANGESFINCSVCSPLVLTAVLVPTTSTAIQCSSTRIASRTDRGAFAPFSSFSTRSSATVPLINRTRDIVTHQAA